MKRDNYRLKKFEQYLAEGISSLNEASLQKALSILKKDGITGKFPDEEKLAKAIHKNYKSITGEDYENADMMSMDDTIADLMGHFKVDGGDFYDTWVDVIDESYEASLIEGEVLIYDSILADIDALKNKIEYLKDKTTDSSWRRSLSIIQNKIEKLDQEISKYDSKHGAIPLEESLTESKKTLNKLSKELHGVTTKMANTVSLWKAAKTAGNDKEVQKYLKELKTLTQQKKRLEVEVNDAVMGTDTDAELSAAFESLSPHVYRRMDGLVSQRYLKQFKKSVKSIVNDFTDEGFDTEEAFEWLTQELELYKKNMWLNG